MATGGEKFVCSRVFVHHTLVDVAGKAGVEDGKHIAVGVFKKRSLRPVPVGLGRVPAVQMIAMRLGAVAKQDES
jgi:hypothetical protein